MTVAWPWTEKDVADTELELAAARRKLDQIDDNEPLPGLADRHKAYRDGYAAEVERLERLVEEGRAALREVEA